MNNKEIRELEELEKTFMRVRHVFDEQVVIDLHRLNLKSAWDHFQQGRREERLVIYEFVARKKNK